MHNLRFGDISLVRSLPYAACGLGLAFGQTPPRRALLMESPILNAHHEWVAVCGAVPSRKALSLRGGRFDYRVKYGKAPDAKAPLGTRASGDYRLAGTFEVVNPQPDFKGKPPMLGLRLNVDRGSAQAAGIGEEEIRRNVRDFGCAYRVDFFLLDEPCPLLFDAVTVLVPKDLAVKLTPKAKAWYDANVKAVGTPGIP